MAEYCIPGWPIHRPAARGWLCVVLFCCMSWTAASAEEVVLIGGPKSHGIGEHDFPNGISVLADLIAKAPAAQGLKVLTFPDGWPASPHALDGASTIVLYFDGAQTGEDEHPLADAAHRAAFEKVMRAGVGVIALHQASTVGVDDTSINLQRWLGGARYGTFDRTEETVRFKPVPHPITRGVGDFDLTDEFYPTIRFAQSGPKPTPLLIAKLHPQFRQGKGLVIGAGESYTVAWAFERPYGGRAFTFTGMHNLVGLDNPPIRTLLLNAIFWTAKREVPRGGVHTTAAGDLAQKIVDREAQMAAPRRRTIEEAVVTRASQAQVLPQPWGQLTWYVSRELKNSDTMTVGQAIINPGQENPRHYHPNCDEVLHVIKGHILHSMGSQTVEMHEGDTVSIPAGVRHNAKNLGTEPAILSISFSSADRIAIGE
jgi:quercetin dioxygenase-like cupin family protein/type 1 glutamine amidotransferase